MTVCLSLCLFVNKQCMQILLVGTLIKIRRWILFQLSFNIKCDLVHHIDKKNWIFPFTYFYVPLWSSVLFECCYFFLPLNH